MNEATDTVVIGTSAVNIIQTQGSEVIQLPRVEQLPADPKRQHEMIERLEAKLVNRTLRKRTGKEWNRRYPNGATLGEIHELPDGSTLIPIIAKET